MAPSTGVTLARVWQYPPISPLGIHQTPPKYHMPRDAQDRLPALCSRDPSLQGEPPPCYSSGSPHKRLTIAFLAVVLFAALLCVYSTALSHRLAQKGREACLRILQ